MTFCIVLIDPCHIYIYSELYKILINFILNFLGIIIFILVNAYKVVFLFQYKTYLSIFC